MLTTPDWHGPASQGALMSTPTIKLVVLRAFSHAGKVLQPDDQIEVDKYLGQELIGYRKAQRLDVVAAEAEANAKAEPEAKPAKAKGKDVKPEAGSETKAAE